ncbi:hypothetical protein ACUN7V_05230 [Quadrisphaera oryzae]|uniref:hypothetical protein n=1 Tax=Quadrisphaera TaxID=317661 RepID=UPI001647014F|nr:hypothetical protein [Quadrisphaera sp. RL12-1S]MBC3762531.1 hypothetical protein [Quadrisphaera sp. RL12-1S]
MLNPDRCASVRSFRQQCELGVLHDGDHVHGTTSWPRSARESASYQRRLAQVRQLRDRALQLRRER